MTQPIRPATARDIPDLLPMIAALATHHGDPSHASAETLTRDLFGPPPWATALIAPQRRGYAVLVPRLRLQNGTRGADLHHLFVAPEARGQGLGGAFLRACCDHLRASGGAFLHVGTHPDNHAAQRFYQSHGFTRRQGGAPQFALSLSDPALTAQRNGD